MPCEGRHIVSQLPEVDVVTRIRNSLERVRIVKRTTVEILQDTRQTLRSAQIGLKDFIGSAPERRITGLHNAVVFGRAVTNVLQCLRATEPDFDEWYLPRQEELKNDPLMKYFYELRSVILKQGRTPMSHSAGIGYFDSSMLSRMPPPPPGRVRSTFILDSVGGSGYEMEMADGSVEKFYVSLPIEAGAWVKFQFDGVPASVPKPAAGSDPAGSMLNAYVERLAELVREAELRFSVPSSLA